MRTLLYLLSFMIFGSWAFADQATVTGRNTKGEACHITFQTSRQWKNWYPSESAAVRVWKTETTVTNVLTGQPFEPGEQKAVYNFRPHESYSIATDLKIELSPSAQFQKAVTFDGEARVQNTELVFTEWTGWPSESYPYQAVQEEKRSDFELKLSKNGKPLSYSETVRTRIRQREICEVNDCNPREDERCVPCPEGWTWGAPKETGSTQEICTF